MSISEILVDRLILEQCETLGSIDSSEVTLHFVNFFSAEQVVDCSKFDLVLVDRQWLHLAPLLMGFLQQDVCRPQNCREARIVIAAKGVDRILRIQALHRGFHDCLELEQSPESLSNGVKAMMNPDSNAGGDTLLASVPQPPMVHNPAEIPRDEIDRTILELVTVGMQDADIATVVYTSTQTVKNRIHAMLSRSGLRNRTQLASSFCNQTIIETVIRMRREYASTKSTGRS